MPLGAPPKHARDGGRTASAGGAHSHPNDPELPLLRLVTHYRLYSKHVCVPKQGQRAVSPMPGPGPGGGCRRVLDCLRPLCRKAPGVQEPQGPPGEGTGERPRKSPGLLGLHHPAGPHRTPDLAQTCVCFNEHTTPRGRKSGRESQGDLWTALLHTLPSTHLSLPTAPSGGQRASTQGAAGGLVLPRVGSGPLCRQCPLLGPCSSDQSSHCTVWKEGGGWPCMCWAPRGSEGHRAAPEQWGAGRRRAGAQGRGHS